MNIPFLHTKLHSFLFGLWVGVLLEREVTPRVLRWLRRRGVGV